MIHSVHFIQQYSPIIIDLYGRRYVARAYGARRPDDLWDGWFVFFPLDGARPLATDRETTQSNLGAIRYWASGITSVYLHGALDRARALLPEARLARRQAQAEQEEALARSEAAAYEEAAAAARIEALDAERRRRETEEQLLVEREATAQAAARLHDRAAASARLDAIEARRRRREFKRQRAGASRPPLRAEARDAAPASRRRKKKA